jgi:hypothetical protein
MRILAENSAEGQNEEHIFMLSLLNTVVLVAVVVEEAMNFSVALRIVINVTDHMSSSLLHDSFITSYH